MAIPYNADPFGFGSRNGVPIPRRSEANDVLDRSGSSDSVRDLLVRRDSTHGDWKIQSVSAQKIKTALRDCGHWDALHPSQKEALESIATKISRILNGNPNEPDHWNDIAGYAKLGII